MFFEEEFCFCWCFIFTTILQGPTRLSQVLKGFANSQVDSSFFKFSTKRFCQTGTNFLFVLGILSTSKLFHVCFSVLILGPLVLQS